MNDDSPTEPTPTPPEKPAGGGFFWWDLDATQRARRALWTTPAGAVASWFYFHDRFDSAWFPALLVVATLGGIGHALYTLKRGPGAKGPERASASLSGVSVVVKTGMVHAFTLAETQSARRWAGVSLMVAAMGSSTWSAGTPAAGQDDKALVARVVLVGLLMVVAFAIGTRALLLKARTPGSVTTAGSALLLCVVNVAFGASFLLLDAKAARAKALRATFEAPAMWRELAGPPRSATWASDDDLQRILVYPGPTLNGTVEECRVRLTAMREMMKQVPALAQDVVHQDVPTSPEMACGRTAMLVGNGGQEVRVTYGVRTCLDWSVMFMIVQPASEDLHTLLPRFGCTVAPPTTHPPLD